MSVALGTCDATSIIKLKAKDNLSCFDSITLCQVSPSEKSMSPLLGVIFVRISYGKIINSISEFSSVKYKQPTPHPFWCTWTS
jgi:hypothetical protein